MTRPEHWSHDRDHFYKYMTADTARLVLQNRTLRWSAPKLFNDPFDIQFDLQLEYDRDRAVKEAMNEIWEIYSGVKPIVPNNALGLALMLLRDRAPGMTRQELEGEMLETLHQGIDNAEAILPETQAAMRAVISDHKVLCLTEVHDNILMWSHYARSHTGVVIRLTCIDDLDSAWGVAQPVRYQAAMPRLLDERQTIQLMSGQGGIDKENLFANSVYTKAADWAYEKEWRLVGRWDQTRETEDINFNSEELTGVYFGCRISDADRQDLSALIEGSYSHAAMFEAQKSEQAFSLVFNETG